MVSMKSLISISNSQKKLMKRGLSENQVHVQYDDLLTFFKKNGGNHVSHLIFLKDKKQFWTKDLNVLIVYKKIFDKYVVLGDPLGTESNFHKAIKEFNEFCKKNRVKPIYYQVNPRYMQLYHDAGFRFMKLGEEALIELNSFSLDGKRGAKLRTRLNKFTRNGFTFRVLQPPHSPQHISDIKSISQCWLGTEKEKGFSVVSFYEDYVSRFPIALMQDPQGKIIAFATLPTNYKQTVTIDLMRNCKQSPHGTMDVLFTNIILWAKESGFHKCSLGMAPLANVGNCEDSFISEKLLQYVYRYGNKKYNFKGLKEFKGKFATDWEPKYLAYKKSLLPIVFLQLILLINRNKRQPNTILKKNIARKVFD
ncbi:phosphatidylglycerol lysyltransferase domain-containing protein [Ureibacillus chungkukjangi]|uniref:Phosphatidylglycerol lysyltransferase n=1 Tax=Ureibacillus chungkukjangi TaxID=1202712 RepID=A0A318U1S9_9BACL|nr:phosphatidylglycerol lysyltransferase domain-containing protein [Ureibacillus chungkukjangi]MCM3388592.1 phosphatidylglycerol lysyltransferase domain-containing protein [Ureibacillus chungkukjangi]PYF05909.1 phosphatidylglycerol lysyltransferase [Ureibacillus chungkukjangi]